MPICLYSMHADLLASCCPFQYKYFIINFLGSGPRSEKQHFFNQTDVSECMSILCNFILGLVKAVLDYAGQPAPDYGRPTLRFKNNETFELLQDLDVDWWEVGLFLSSCLYI